MTLNDLKPGDKVVLRYGFNEMRLETVSKVTAHHVICANTKYRRKDGYQVCGGVWSRIRIVLPTPELLDDIQRRNLADEMEAVKWKDLPLETLRAVATVLKERGAIE